MDATEEMTRPAWMGLLAKAPEALLGQLWEAAGIEAAHEWLRPPEIGAVMVRGRTGGTGAPFNLGEMTVTRCALRLVGGPAGGQVGHAYVAGRSLEKARIAALCDALLQVEAQAVVVRDTMLTPLEKAAAEARETMAAKAAATKVEFFTLARKRT
jgi:alpha-D-ribose 1-methylphosphonate 5-triphosphate synthase subunit PhnG